MRVEMRALSKHGRPFLLVPCQPGPAATSLELYPAQTGRARVARSVLRCLLRSAVPLGTKKIRFVVPSEDAFAAFLCSQAGTPKGKLPTLGLLAGNPASDGQRFLLLVFDANQRPVAVVKAGSSERARVLIDKEESFLATVAKGTSSIPKLRGTFQSDRLRALALDFYTGDSPRPRDEGALPALLASWVDTQRTVALCQSPDWVRLAGAASGNELFERVDERLRELRLHPAIHHGDFAPWNIKVSPAGAWTVLDWERGERIGIPGWDWFHYLIQPAILVEHLPTAGLVQQVLELLDSGTFRPYAVRTGIAGYERELVLAYLLHAAEVIKPSEGLAPTCDLMRALATRWRQG